MSTRGFLHTRKFIHLLIILILGLFSLTVLAKEYESEFFGIQVLDIKKVKGAFSVRRNEEGGVSYKRNPNITNDKVFAWGEFSMFGGYRSSLSTTIRFQIVNNSKMPIKMNYFIDEYGLITKDDTSYILEIKDEITDYPNLLNPKERSYVSVKKPSGIKLDDIKYILIYLEYGKVIIVLKRIDSL